MLFDVYFLTPQGQEELPMMSPRAQADTGYTRWVDTRSNLQHKRVRSVSNQQTLLVFHTSWRYFAPIVEIR